MLRFSYRVTGDKAVISMFSALSNLTPAELDREVVGPWARRTRAVLKSTPYPNERPGQVYIRTGQLANRWKTVQVGGQWHIVNEATDPRGRIYPVYVVGDEEGEDQAWMHEGRWWLFRSVIDTALPDLLDELEQYAYKLAGLSG